MTGTVEAINLVVGYDSILVADAGSFVVHPERISVVTGPNGSGKTTLLKTLAGLLPPLSGQLVPQLPSGRGGVVYVHSTPYLFAGTVRRNMQIISPGSGALDALRVLGVEDLLHQDVRRLSTGQRQRVALARAIATSPRVLIVDEPEGGLDDDGILSWRQMMERAVAAGDPSIVIATHDVSAVEGLPMHVVHLRRRK